MKPSEHPAIVSALWVGTISGAVAIAYTLKWVGDQGGFWAAAPIAFLVFAAWYLLYRIFKWADQEDADV